MTLRVPVNPELLHWALRRSGRTPEGLSSRFKKLTDWLEGKVQPNVINLRPNSLFCRKISSIHHHLKESEMNSVPAVPTTDQAVLPKII